MIVIPCFIHLHVEVKPFGLLSQLNHGLQLISSCLVS
jgi:hypothetical protein